MIDFQNQILFGFININKPKGITSFDVIHKLRSKLHIKKIGHSGTLDPLASGVLPVAIGDCTRLLEYLESDKKYIAEIKFGETSSTYDEEGEKTKIKEPNFSYEELGCALKSFVGKIEQKPPMYSAIKVKGQKLYTLARRGIEIDVPKRTVEVYEIKILDFKLPYIKIEVFCSSGTYIRSIANDLGQILGCGAYMSELQRTMACGFTIDKSCDIENIGEITNPIDVIKLRKYELSDDECEKIKNGNSIQVEISGKNEMIMLLYRKKLVSISELSDKIIKVHKVFKQNFEE